MVTYQATRELLFSDIATAQWLTTRPAEARVCMYSTDRPADRLFLCARITRKRFGRFRSFKHCLQASGRLHLLGPGFVHNLEGASMGL